jgi:hypothetical protein
MQDPQQLQGKSFKVAVPLGNFDSIFFFTVAPALFG